MKSLNVLLTGDLRAKISDFGTIHIRNLSIKTKTLSPSLKSLKPGKNGAGSLRWLAPELFNRHALNTKESDVYSLGMIFWEILTQKLPFENAREE